MAEEKKVGLKLLVDTKANKVLFAEAGKDFVDFLFSILSLPMGTVVKLLDKKGLVSSGSLGDLYKSINALSSDYLQPGVPKDSVLKPLITYYASRVPPLVLDDAASTLNSKTFHTYSCNCSVSSYDVYVAGEPSTAPSNCFWCRTRKTKLNYLNSSEGYVKGGTASYMVMDNLEVKPASALSGFAYIDKLGVKDVSYVEQKEVKICLKEGIALLEASLQTKAVLTTVFL